jgi:hypothetical protein
MGGALVLFLTGRPAGALAGLWGNPYEVRNTAICAAVLAVVALVATFRPSPLRSVIAVLAVLFLMAGPVAALWGLVAGFVVVALGFQLIGSKARVQLAGR